MDLAGVPGGVVAGGLVTVIGRADGGLGEPGGEQFAQASYSTGDLVHAARPSFYLRKRCRGAAAGMARTGPRPGRRLRTWPQ